MLLLCLQTPVASSERVRASARPPPRAPFLHFHSRCTGCSGPMAARMAILKAARQLAVEANVHVHIRKFSVSRIAYRTCTLLVHSMLFFGAGALLAVASGGASPPLRRSLIKSALARSTPSSTATPSPPRTRRRRTTIARPSWASRGAPEGSPSAAARCRPTTLPAFHAHGACACACAEIYSTGKANLPGSTRQRGPCKFPP